MTMLDRLSPRERGLVIGGGAILLGLGLWLYGWQPLVQQRAEQQDRIARYLAVLGIADQVAPTGQNAGSPCTGSTGLSRRVTQSAEAAGIPLARLDPEGPHLRITVAQTAYLDAMAWIAALEAGRCVRATAVEMSRLTGPGQVSLRLSLEDAR